MEKKEKNKIFKKKKVNYSHLLEIHAEKGRQISIQVHKLKGETMITIGL